MSSDFQNCVGFSVIKLEPHKHVIKIGSFKPPPPSRPKLPANAPPENDFSLKDALCDQRMLQNMAKSPVSFVATLG